jgi:hypothetical protein
MDVLTKAEMAQVMDQMSRTWMAEITRGIKHRRFQARAPVVGGALSIAPSVDNDLGPGGSMAWAVKALAVTGLAAGDGVDVWINGADPVYSLLRATAPSGAITRAGFGENELILGPNDYLTVTGSGLVATGTVAVFGRCAEVPRTLIYKLQ